MCIPGAHHKCGHVVGINPRAPPTNHPVRDFFPFALDAARMLSDDSARPPLVQTEMNVQRP